MSPPPKIRVLVVDDSAVVRRVVREALAADPGIDVVGAAADAYEARDKIAALSPDVLTLDLEMPRMDGLTFLRLLMARAPLPVVVLSSLTPAGSGCAFEALRLGAVEVMGKPSGRLDAAELSAQLVAKVHGAAQARPARLLPDTAAGRPAATGQPAQGTEVAEHDPRSLILLGASTGGVSAIRDVLSRLPSDMPPIAIVQHIPALFSKTFAERLDSGCALSVREAADGDRLTPGTALVAPGGLHLRLRWSGSAYVARVSEGPAVWHQRPAVDVLFASAADAGAGAHCTAGVLTGMGQDGAEGLLRLRQAGAATFAQDEASSVVYGMPRAAFERGAAQAVLPLEAVPHFLLRHRHLRAAPLATQTQP